MVGSRTGLNLFDPSSAEVRAALDAAAKLPTSLGPALDALDAAATLRDGLGDDFVDAYLKLRRQHWAQYCGTVTDWERAQYLDV